MNRRKEKKAIKKKWHLTKWPGNADPRDVNECCIALGEFFDRVFVPIIREQMEGQRE